jgi:hypothetical protein
VSARDRLGFDHRGLSDDDLGALLRQAFSFPPSRDLAADVVQRLPAQPRRGQGWTCPRLSRGVVLALLALLVAGAVAAAAILGVPGIRILFTGQLERPEPAVTTPPGALDRMRQLGLGTRISLDEVREKVDMAVAPPAHPALGPPDALFLDPSLAGGMVSMVWVARTDLAAAGPSGVGLLISQFDGTVNPRGFQKLVDQGVSIEPVSVAGSAGWWLHGATHVFLRGRGTGADQQYPVVETRLAGDTLLWERDGITYRLEGSIGLELAIQIAESIGGNGSDASGVSPS